MSAADRYRAAIEKCERNARTMRRPEVREIWTTLQDSYRLLLEMERFGILHGYSDRRRF